MTKTRIVYVAARRTLKDGRTVYQVRRDGRIVKAIATLDDLGPLVRSLHPQGVLAFWGDENERYCGIY